MIRTIDTSAWIEWFAESETGFRVADLLPQRQECVVPTIVQFELLKWLMRNVDDPKTNNVLIYTQYSRIVPLDLGIAFYAAELAVTHKLTTADAIIYATALLHDAELLTCDAHFEGLDGVNFIPKRSG